MSVDPEDLKPLDVSQAVVWLEPGKPKVYVRRWFVLASLSLTYFAWNASSGRGTAVSTAYARHYNVNNEVNGENGGYDLLPVSESAVLLVTYLLGAWAVDKYGLKSMIVGSFAIMLGSWVWFIADDNYALVLVGRTIASVFGGVVPASILAVSNRWFPESERGMATAIGSLFSLLGAAAALVLASFYYTNDFEVVDPELKSCKPADLSAATVIGLVNATASGEFYECGDDAKDAFCCYQPLDIRGLDLLHAVMPTLAFIFTALSVRDMPPTAPSAAAEKKESVSIFRGLIIIFSNTDFAKVALSDFIVSGPVLVLYAALARVFPSSIDELAFAASATGLGLALPAALIVARLLDKYKWYYFFTAGGYVAGTVVWILATISFASGTLAGAYAYFAFAVSATMLYVAWQAAVYEYKLEKVFSHDTALEGVIVGADRSVINLANLVFISSITPERVGSVINFYGIGAAIMIIGCVPVLLIKDKFGYNRTIYDKARKEADASKLSN